MINRFVRHFLDKSKVEHLDRRLESARSALGILIDQQNVADLLERLIPQSGKTFLAATSAVTQPFLLTHGISVVRLESDVCEIHLADWVLNRGSNGATHPSALTLLIEHSTRLYWERVLDREIYALELRGIRLAIDQHLSGQKRAVFRLASEEKNEVLKSVRALAGEWFVAEGNVVIYDEAGRQAAEGSASWKIRLVRAIAAKT